MFLELAKGTETSQPVVRDNMCSGLCDAPLPRSLWMGTGNEDSCPQLLEGQPLAVIPLWDGLG